MKTATQVAYSYFTHTDNCKSSSSKYDATLDTWPDFNYIKEILSVNMLKINLHIR